MIARCGALAGFVFLLLASAAPAAPGDLPAPLAAKIDGDVNAALHRFMAPGAVVMVVQDGRVTFVRAYGLRDVAGQRPVRTDTLFEIGSLTKQFTAASILQLQEAGKLQIDRPLADYLPDAPHAKEITLRQMLNLTAGLHDYLDGPQAELEKAAAQPMSYHDLIARIAPLPLDFPPGSQWAYSNTDYLLLGKVIEAVSGESFGDYLRHHIFTPLHMGDTHTMAEENNLMDMAIGYRSVNGRLQLAPHIGPSWAGAAGFLIMTLADLAKWDEALSGGKIVSSADYREMTTSAMTTKNGSANYGFGFFVDSVYGQPRIGHTGGSWAFTTADEYFPAQNTRIIAFTNLGNETPEAGEALTNIVFADLFPAIAAKARTPAPGERPDITQVARDAFQELQVGTNYARFNARLKGKLSAGVGAGFVASLGPYGAPTGAVFKGLRREAGDSWYEYVMEFGPGVSLPFAVRIDKDALVAGISVG
ncbi:MAG TPA: serine hydrolase domain-containing protein [Rhizomicrobium sp.]|jgi:CubicO group peptidase (beta-lactamase class C family)